MDLDPLSIIAPARVKVLLLPVGNVRQSRFASFVQRLQQVNVVRLGDVSPDSRPHRTMFSPLAFPEGLILYDLTTILPPMSHLALSPFELYREPLVVVGIADAKDLGSKNSHSERENGLDAKQEKAVSRVEGLKSLVQILEDLLDDFPKVLVHQILVFDHDETALPERIYPVPSPAKSRTTTIKTIMCDLTSRLLAEMTTFAKSLQGLSMLDSPKVTTRDTASNGTASAVPARMTELSRNTGSRSFSPEGGRSSSQHRTSIPAKLPLGSISGHSTPGSRPTSPPNDTHTPTASLNDITGSSLFQSPPKETTNDKPESRGRVSTSGFGSGSLGERERNKVKGRVGIVIGAMYLLTGRWPDAVKELVSNAAIAQNTSDYLWHAKAMDYVLVCLLMYAWAGMDFRIPENFFPGTERPGSSVSKPAKHTSSNSLPEMNASMPVDSANRAASLQTLTSVLPDLATNIMNLYSRAWTFTDDKLPPLAFAQSAIRFAKLLSSIQLSNGVLDDALLGHLVLNLEQPTNESSSSDVPPFMTRGEIVDLVFRAYPGPNAEPSMTVSDRTTIFAGIAAVLSDLKYHRKKALVLKDLMSSLLPALVQARKAGAAEMGVHPAASLASLNAAVNTVALKSSVITSDGSEQGMKHFLSLVCQAYGIVPFHSIDDDKVEPTASNGKKTRTSSPAVGGAYAEAVASRALQQASSKMSGSQDLKIDILRSCINICEALPDLSGALHYSAELLRLGASGIAPGPDSSDGSPDLAIDEQVRLVNNISRTLSVARQLGFENQEAEYWDDFLVRGIEVVDVNPARSLQPHSKSELEIVETIDAKKEKSPFIYNPFLKSNAAPAAEPLLVAREEAFFRVTLQNLSDFDVEVERIKVVSHGATLESVYQSILIGPYRTQTTLLSGTPQLAGRLTIHGCSVKIKGCRERSFLHFNEPWSLKVDVKNRHVHLAKRPRPAAILVESGKGKPQQSFKGPIPTTLSLNVLGAQPNIAMKSISIPQLAIMLLEGETANFTITLSNTSWIDPVDLLLLSFDDSLASQRQSAISNKELSAVELYELELASARKQTLRWRSRHDIQIDPGSVATLDLEVLGKSGLSHGTIQVDYCHLGIPRAQIQDTFYTRQLMIPLTITVNPSLDIVSSDIINLPKIYSTSDLPQREGDTTTLDDLNQRPHSITADDKTTKPDNSRLNIEPLLNRIRLSSASTPYCLLLLDIHNSWTNTLILSLELSPPSPTSHPFTHTQPLHANTTTRIPIPLSRLYMPNPHQPIPSLNPSTKRQFVVSTTKSNPSAERALRENFWYREELLSQLKASWKEESTGRIGDVDLRTIKLTSEMIAALKLPDLDIGMTISSAEPSSEVHQTTASDFKVPTTTFLTLHTHLYNRSSDPIRPLLRLQPALANQPQSIALDLNKKLLVNGILQRALPELGPGERSTVETGFMVLAGGRYEWGAVVEEVVALGRDEGGGKRVGGRARAATGEMDVLGERGRRMWVMEGRCGVVATDEEGDGDEAEDNPDNS